LEDRSLQQDSDLLRKMLYFLQRLHIKGQPDESLRKFRILKDASLDYEYVRRLRRDDYYDPIGSIKMNSLKNSQQIWMFFCIWDMPILFKILVGRIAEADGYSESLKITAGAFSRVNDTGDAPLVGGRSFGTDYG
jgi:hypothetical protein